MMLSFYLFLRGGLRPALRPSINCGPVCKGCKIMYDANKVIIFSRRRHNQILFKKRFRLDVRKFAFCIRVVNDWNSLSSQRVNCVTVNTFKNIFQLNWNHHLLNYISCMLFEIVGVIWRLSLCLLMPAVFSTLLVSVISVKYLVDTK